MARTYREVAIEEMVQTVEEAMSQVIDWWGDLPAPMKESIEQFPPRSLLSIAKSKSARSRIRPSTCSLVRIDQTSLVCSGGFEPTTFDGASATARTCRIKGACL